MGAGVEEGRGRKGTEKEAGEREAGGTEAGGEGGWKRGEGDLKERELGGQPEPQGAGGL